MMSPGSGSLGPKKDKYMKTYEMIESKLFHIKFVCHLYTALVNEETSGSSRSRRSFLKLRALVKCTLAI